MSEKETTMIAHCGLNCGQCDVYLATQADDDAKRAETARAWSKHFGWQLVPEDIMLLMEACSEEYQNYRFPTVLIQQTPWS